MAQDLTPQLRTRLSKVERAVGIFVTLATLLFLAGFVYYIYHTAQRKGWFVTKIEYQTSLANATGLKVGDPVKLMGFVVGDITKVEANDPNDYYNVTVYFKIKAPYFGYVWSDSKAKVAGADFLGNRYLEVMKGKEGMATVSYDTNKNVIGVLDRQKYQETLDLEFKNRTNEVAQKTGKEPVGEELEALRQKAIYAAKETAYKNPTQFFQPLKKYERYWVDPVESMAVTERLEALADTVEKALPNFLGLTNQLISIFEKADSATGNLDTLLESARPTVTNLALLSDQMIIMTSNLNSGPGALGQLLIPTNTQQQIDQLLAAANSTLDTTQTNLGASLSNLNLTFINLADITSNLNSQVAANPTLISNISALIVRSDEMMQGLKKHWLLRSAFKTKPTNAPPRKPVSAPKPGKK